MTKIAVVILNFNGASFLKQFLPSVLRFSKEASVIVADNNSSDHSLELLQSNFPEVRTIILPKNYGYAGGYNEALKQISAEYFVLLNSDVEVTENWLNPLVSFLDQNPNYAAVQPKLLDYNSKQQFEYAGAAGGYLDALGYPYCKGRIFDTLEKDTGQYDDRSDLHWCTGACFVIRAEDFRKVGGFDADFFAHMEEIDLCWRLSNAERKLAYIPTSTVFHVGGGTLNKTSPFKTYLNFRNNLTMIAKNERATRLIWIIPLRMLLDILAGLKFWKDQSFDHFKAVLKAEKDFLRNRTTIRSKRRLTQPGTVKHSGFILMSYYFKGRKTFKELNNTK